MLIYSSSDLDSLPGLQKRDTCRGYDQNFARGMGVAIRGT